MPSWAARTGVVGDSRAERNPTEMPARCAQTIAMPSRMPNVLLSVPSAWIWTRPSVSTPSTSNRISLIGCACSSTDKCFCPPWSPIPEPWPLTSHELRPPEFVQVHNTGELSLGAGDDDGRDSPPLHDVQRFGRECL